MARAEKAGWFAQPSGDYIADITNAAIWQRVAEVKAFKKFMKDSSGYSDTRIHDARYITDHNSGMRFYLLARSKHIESYKKDNREMLVYHSTYLTYYTHTEPYFNSDILKRFGTIIARIVTPYGDVELYQAGVAVIYGEYTREVIPFFFADTMMPYNLTWFLKNFNSLTSTRTERGGKKIFNPFKLKSWKAVLPSVIAVASIYVLGAAAGTLASTIGSGAGLFSLAGVGAVGGLIAGVGGVITTFGMIGGSKTLSKIGARLGAVGALLSIGGSISNFFSPSAAKAGASTLPNYSLANSQNLSQTSSLYHGISPASWANGTGGAANSLYQNTNSVMFSSEANSFSSALRGYNTGATASGITSANSSLLYLTKGLEVAKFGFKSYEAVSNLISAFRAPNEFKDDDMPQNNNEGGLVSVSSALDEFENAGYNVRRFYDRDIEYDLGFESGTLMSNDGSLLGG
ncbi:hypothetical protein [Campylobacter showae]|uniref:hypothetical protein n=1 Tax=Campylobacter showae TaxID=204 RepID=UPI0028D5C30A|nr:hypothetical protein [Campylobacter showae]